MTPPPRRHRCAKVTALARRALEQEVVILDPVGKQTDALNPMEAIQPATRER